MSAASCARRTPERPQPTEGAHSLAPVVNHIAYIGLGSNLGDRAAHLQKGVGRLNESPSVEVTDASPVYESPALTQKPSESAPPFLNAVIRVHTVLNPHALLHLLLEVETMEGRVRNRLWEPRTLDLDLLLYDDETENSEDLTLPHPGLSSRAFVLRPLADLNPALMLPAPLSTSVYSLLENCPHLDELRRTDLVLLAPPC